VATIGKTIFLHLFILKKIFFRTSSPISIKLGTNHSCVYQMGDNHKNAKVIENFSP
jgi:hypothetical protein